MVTLLLKHAIDPDEEDDCGFDWRWNLAVGETLSSVTVTVTGGTVIIAPSINGTTSQVRVKPTSGAVQLDVVFTVVTSTGRKLQETLRIPVAQR